MIEPGRSTILLIRPDGNQADEQALARLGIASLIEPLVRVVPAEDPGAARRLARVLAESGEGSWLVVTSPRTWRYWQAAVSELNICLATAVDAGLRLASVGVATTGSLPEWVRQRVVTSSGISAEQLLSTLLEYQPGKALIPASARARDLLPTGLVEAGWQVHRAEIYDVVSASKPPPSLNRLSDGTLAGVVVRSPSAADALAELAPGPLRVPVFAVGPITAKRCRSRGWQVIEIDGIAPARVAEVVAAAL
ncbi:MAG: uroporphyrinogen-III synthase [Brooklawnia sp.]|jgi:uroporphyrinogen III methyltransferase/synthase